MTEAENKAVKYITQMHNDSITRMVELEKRNAVLERAIKMIANIYTIRPEDFIEQAEKELGEYAVNEIAESLHKTSCGKNS